MSTPIADVITRYFESSARRDTAAVVALFTDDAVVVDEGQTRRGINQIRDWREYTTSAYQYTTDVLSTEHVGEDSYLVMCRLTGNFSGGTADLRFQFTIAGDRISRLEIVG